MDGLEQNTRDKDASSTQKKTVSRVRGIDRVVHILDHLHHHGRPMRINEIAKGIKAPRSTVYEIVDLLIKENILAVFDEEGRVFLGRKLYYFGLAYADKFDLTREAEKHLDTLTEKTGETSQLCLMEGSKYAVVMMKHGARHFKVSSHAGDFIPVPWTASGRLLMSHLSIKEIRDLVPESDFVLPDGAQMSIEAFYEEIREVGPTGFYSCDTLVDSYTHCFAASVINEQRECVATLCLVVPREEAYRRYDELKAALVGEAKTLSHSLGGRGPVNLHLEIA